ncbi:MAG: hypothetical protein K2K36_06590 [Muribaculaceae bacterium]|nr:hypothetical protein [Muribaculaceae bacterium]
MENITPSPRSRIVLESARQAWIRMAPLRQKRARFLRYTYGDQWSDPVTDRDGNTVTERAQLTLGGRQPLTNNLIRRMVKAVVGRYRMGAEENRTGASGSQSAAPDPMERLRALNRLDEVDARTLEEFLISGIAVHRVCAERRACGSGVWIDNVSPDRFFINAVTDPRCTDMELVGTLHDMSLPEVLMRFSRGDRRRAERIRQLYGAIAGASAAALGASSTLHTGFAHAPHGRCRVVEAWTLECREILRCHDPLLATYSEAEPAREQEIARENRRRRREALPRIDVKWEAVTSWVCRMMAPDGSLLDEFRSPLPDGRPPFAVKMYPLVDGDVHSLVEDVIDQQRHVNRLITLMDHMMGTAAKGVLLFPRDCKLPGTTWKQMAAMWADPGGIIPYQPSKLSEPHQVVTPMADIGARDMLRTQIQLFEDVSGVTDTLMGKTVSGAIGVDRYNTELRNASVAVADLLRTYADFIACRDSIALTLAPAGPSSASVEC